MHGFRQAENMKRRSRPTLLLCAGLPVRARRFPRAGRDREPAGVATPSGAPPQGRPDPAIAPLRLAGVSIWTSGCSRDERRRHVRQTAARDGEWAAARTVMACGGGSPRLPDRDRAVPATRRKTGILNLWREGAPAEQGELSFQSGGCLGLRTREHVRRQCCDVASRLERGGVRIPALPGDRCG